MVSFLNTLDLFKSGSANAASQMHTISKNAINPKFYQGPSRTFLLGSGLCLHKNDQYIMRQIENYQAQEDNYYLILGLSFTI